MQEEELLPYPIVTFHNNFSTNETNADHRESGFKFTHIYKMFIIASCKRSSLHSLNETHFRLIRGLVTKSIAIGR